MLRLTKRYVLQASLADAWQALTDPDTLAEWLGEDVVMNTWPDGSFSLWEGSVSGFNREVVDQQRLVQDWKEDGWTHLSRVTFSLTPTGRHTQVDLVHEQIPVASFQHVDKLWDQQFFGPLQAWLNGD